MEPRTHAGVPAWFETDRVRRRTIAALVALGLGLLVAHLLVAPPGWRTLLPATVYDVTLSMRFEGYGEPVRVSAFLPQGDERQRVLSEEIVSGSLAYTEERRAAGRVGRWSIERALGEQRVRVRTEIAPQGLRYEIPPSLGRGGDLPDALRPWLAETDVVQASHPEIAELWQRLAPDDPTLVEALRAIFDYTHGAIEGAEFKGTTDALTALRLGQASCNGKSRLFAALARHAGIPVRLVGGLILDSGGKRTSHQWVEAWVAGRWVPFCPTNGYFAEVPQHYLVLYRGDEALFTHTRDINFDYLFDIERRTVPSVDVLPAGDSPPKGVAALGREVGIAPGISRTFLMFPLAALVVLIFKNVIGFESFGIFLPMLIAAAARHTGLAIGLGAFLSIVVLAAFVSRAMSRLHILRGARLAVLITVITLLVLIAVGAAPPELQGRLVLLGLFPTVVLSLTAERLSRMEEQRGLHELIKVLAATTVIILACYAAISSTVLRAAFGAFPELLLLVIAAQIMIGRWAGLRLSELLRFGRVLDPGRGSALPAAEMASRGAASGAIHTWSEPEQPNGPHAQQRSGETATPAAAPRARAPRSAALIDPGAHSRSGPDRESSRASLLGINARNLEVLFRLNATEDVAIADDKVATKRALEKADVPVPETIDVVTRSHDLRQVVDRLDRFDEFVVKPGGGSQGEGILVIVGREAGAYVTAGGRRLGPDDLRRHLTEIFAGSFSDGEPDRALIEARVHPHPFLRELYPDGLSDLRIILVRGRVLAAMLRVPTSRSGGRANLHQGAVGVPVGREDGRLGEGYVARAPIPAHPDTGVRFSGRRVPLWGHVLDVARRAQHAVPLGYAGVDICLDESGPLVLEINARPGLEIQNVHGEGLRSRLRELLAGDAPAREAGR